jgi:hypothetical protein
MHVERVGRQTSGALGFGLNSGESSYLERWPSDLLPQTLLSNKKLATDSKIR